MSFAGGGENNVTITFTGVPGPLQSALRQAGEGMQGFVNTVTQGQRQLAQGMQTGTTAMQGQQQATAQLLQGMAGFIAQLAKVGQAADETGQKIGNRTSANSLSGALTELGDNFGRATAPISRFASRIFDAINPLQMLHSHILRLVEVMGLWRIFEYGTRQISEFTSAIAELPVTMERTEMSWKYTFGMNDPRLQPGGSMYGSILNPDGTVNDQKQTDAATNISRDLAQWSAKFSYNIPYTRQDMLSSISMMGMTGLSEQGVQTYLPLMADLAATAGNNMYGQPVTLTHAAFAIMDANMGLSRSLKTQLRISPEDLKQYGYEEGNPATLWKALSAYSEAKHRTRWVEHGTDAQGNILADKGRVVHLNDLMNDPNIGASGVSDLIASGQLEDLGAAQDIAKHSWFGLSSSWTDRWQNMMMDIGGYAAYDTTNSKAQKNPVIRKLIERDNALRAQAQKMEDTAQLMVGPDGDPTATREWKGAQQLLAQTTWDETGLRRNSPFDMARKGLEALTGWWDSNQQKLNDVATFFSKMLGQGMVDAGDAIQAFIKGVAGSGIGQLIGADFQNFSDWLRNPTTIANIKDLALNLGNDLGTALTNVQSALGNVKQGWDNFWNAFTPQERQDLKDLVVGDVKGGKGSGLLGALDDALKTVSKSIARTGKEAGFLVTALTDLKNGDLGGAAAALAQQAKMSLEDSGIKPHDLGPDNMPGLQHTAGERGNAGHLDPGSATLPTGGSGWNNAASGGGGSSGAAGNMDFWGSLGWTWQHPGDAWKMFTGDINQESVNMGKSIRQFFDNFGQGWDKQWNKSTNALLGGPTAALFGTITTLFDSLHLPMQNVHNLLTPLADGFTNLWNSLVAILDKIPGVHLDKIPTGGSGGGRAGGGGGGGATKLIAPGGFRNPGNIGGNLLFGV